MARVPDDYDTDPGRWASVDRSAERGSVHRDVGRRLLDEGQAPVLDVGGGDGLLARLLPGLPVVTVDRSPTQLAAAVGPRARADAAALPVPNGAIGAVTMLWMLYHLAEPVPAIAEAYRVLRPGGLLAACAPSRDNDPELVDGYPPSPFDAEEAPQIVASVFGDVEVERWDAPLTLLSDGPAVLRYCRAHRIDRSAAARVAPPVWLTKRGCLVWARRPG